MIERKQLLRHQPHNEIYGDCHRTAVGCLLDLEPWQVPHFIQNENTTPSHPGWLAEQREWLRARGFYAVDVCFDGGSPVEGVFNAMSARNPELLYLMGGTSPRGTDHTVICHGGGFRWDPHPDGGFLVGPLSNGVWEVTFLCPISMTERIDEG